jgi:phage tail protein X
MIQVVVTHNTGHPDINQVVDEGRSIRLPDILRFFQDITLRLRWAIEDSRDQSN